MLHWIAAEGLAAEPRNARSWESPRSHGEHGGLWNCHGAEENTEEAFGPPRDTESPDECAERKWRTIDQRMAIRVMHYGLGPIGAAVVQQVAARRGFKMVGGIDIDPAKVGRDLGEVTGVGRPSWASRSPPTRRKRSNAAKPDVVVLCTSFVAEEGRGRRSRRS